MFILLTLIPSTLWGLIGLLEKYHLLNEFSPIELLILKPPFILLITLIYLFFNINIVNKFITTDIKTLIVFFVVLAFEVIAITTYWYLIQKKSVSWTATYVTPLTLIMTLFMAAVFFKEKVKRLEKIGILIIMIGILCMLCA